MLMLLHRAAQELSGRLRFQRLLSLTFLPHPYRRRQPTFESAVALRRGIPERPRRRSCFLALVPVRNNSAQGRKPLRDMLLLPPSDPVQSILERPRRRQASFLAPVIC